MAFWPYFMRVGMVAGQGFAEPIVAAEELAERAIPEFLLVPLDDAESGNISDGRTLPPNMCTWLHPLGFRFLDDFMPGHFRKTDSQPYQSVSDRYRTMYAMWPLFMTQAFVDDDEFPEGVADLWRAVLTRRSDVLPVAVYDQIACGLVAAASLFPVLPETLWADTEDMWRGFLSARNPCYLSLIHI